jgi:hypothetical protein
MIEERYMLLKEMLSETSLADAMVKLEKAIPCLLHLENRISECLITSSPKGFQSVTGRSNIITGIDKWDETFDE